MTLRQGVARNALPEHVLTHYSSPECIMVRYVVFLLPLLLLLFYYTHCCYYNNIIFIILLEIFSLLLGLFARC